MIKVDQGMIVEKQKVLIGDLSFQLAMTQAALEVAQTELAKYQKHEEKPTPKEPDNNAK